MKYKIGDQVRTLEGGHVHIVAAIWGSHGVILENGSTIFVNGIRLDPDPRKWTPVFVVQGNYGFGHGWEDLCESESRKEARVDWKAYQKDEPDYPHRLIRRLVQNFQEVTP